MPTFTITIIGGSPRENREACERALSYFIRGDVTRGGNVVSEQNGAAHRTTTFRDGITADDVQQTVTRACGDGKTVSVA